MSMKWEVVDTDPEGPKIKNHTATLVKDKIYVFGGYDSRINHSKVHEFDCNRLTWRVLKIDGEPPKGRNGHTATYADGQIFIVGGWLGAGPLAASDLYVLQLNSMCWKRPVAVGNSPGPCNMHTTDYVKQHRSLFVFRGGDGRRYLNDLHLLNIDSFEWKQPKVFGNLPASRANHSSALIDTNLYIFGGWDGSKRLNDVHVLCTKTFTWSQPNISGDPPSPRAGMSFNCVRGKLYLFGGSGPDAKCFNDLQIFDPSTNRWLNVEAKEFSEEEDESSSVSGDHQSSFCSGGRNAEKGDEGMQSMASLSSNPNATCAHASSKPPDVIVRGIGPSERAGHTATLFGRKLIIFGGSCVEKYLGDMFLLDTDCSPQIQVMPTNSAASRLQKMLPSFLDSPQFSDVTFLVDNRPIFCHKMILSLASEQFEGMFRIGADGSCFKEANQKEIVIPDVSYAAFKKTIEYLYTGKLCLEDLFGYQPPAQMKHTSSNSDLTQNMEDAVSSRMSVETYSDNESVECGQAGSSKGKKRARTLGKEYKKVVLDHARINLLMELLSLSDRFLLDHLKQLCEELLSAYLCKETVHDFLQEAELFNAFQLKNLCEHFILHGCDIVED